MAIQPSKSYVYNKTKNHKIFILEIFNMAISWNKSMYIVQIWGFLFYKNTASIK